MTGTTSVRTRRMLHALGWRYSDLRPEFAGVVARTKCGRHDISALFGGTCQVPPSVSVFLCMSVQLAVVRHQVARARRIQERRNSDASNGGDANNPAVQLLARKLAAQAVAAMAQAGVTYKLDVPPHDGFNKLIGMTREWLEKHADLATIPPDAGWETKRVPGARPAVST